MKKALLFSAIVLAAFAPAKAADAKTYPVPIERRVPWIIISGTDSEGSENNPLGGKTGGINDLIDRNPITFWHSNPKDCNGTDENHSHWFLIDRGINPPAFSSLSIQQRVMNSQTDPNKESWNGAVTEADIYVTDEFIGLTGGSDNRVNDDETLYNYLQSQSKPTLTIKPKIYEQEAQIFQFDKEQTGRFILVVIKHTVNPSGNGATHGNAEQYACLSEFNLFHNETVAESNFDGIYSLGDNPKNDNSESRRTHSLIFSNDFTDSYRYSPMLQSVKGQEPYITYLNWLDWERTYFDITNLITVSAAAGYDFEIMPDALGSGLCQHLYIDWDNDGFTAADKVKSTTAGALNAKFEAPIKSDAKLGKYRARYMVDIANTDPNNPSAEIRNGGIVVDFTIAIERPVTFNVRLYYQGKLVERIEQVEGFANVAFTVPSPDFFDIDATAVAPEKNGVTVDLEMVRFLGLPFAFTETEDNMKWQAIQQHYQYKGDSFGDAARYTWTCFGENQIDMAVEEPQDVCTEGFADTQLWAFVGNIAEGFKIYNKSLGTDKWVYTDGKNVMVGNGENCIWKPFYAKNRSNQRYCSFKAEETGFISLDITTNDHQPLTFADDANNSAACWFAAPSDPLLEQVADYNFTYSDPDDDPYFPKTKPVGTYNYNGEDFSDAADIIAAAQSDPYDMEAFIALRTLVDRYESNVEFVTIAPNKWYRIANANGNDNEGFANNYMFTSDNGNEIYSQRLENRKRNYHTLFSFEIIDETPEKFRICSQGRYFGAPQGGMNTANTVGQVDTPEEAGTYELFKAGGAAQWAIGCGFTQGGDKKFLHQGSPGNESQATISGWGAWAGGSHFYIIPAADLEVELTHSHNGSNIGFGYFPFPVTTTGNDETELYYIYQTVDNTDAANPTHAVSYRKVKSVPAHTAFMIVNPTAEVVVLNIDSDAAKTREAAPANVLHGSLLAITAEEGDYIATTGEDGMLSFVKVEAGTDIKGNFAYIPAANISEEAASVNALPLIEPQVDPIEITVTPVSVELTEGDTIQLVAEPKNATDEDTVTWISSDNSVATVSETGMVTAVGAGEATITATCGDATATCQVKVNAKPVEDSISEIGANQSKAEIFDLQGRRLSAPARGLYIINGKKAIVK